MGNTLADLAFTVLSIYICIFAHNAYALDEVDLADDGGWWTDKEGLIAHPGPCNIEVRDSSLTQQEFLDRYANTAPVIIKGLSNKDFREQCRKNLVLKDHGHKTVRLSSANTHSYRKVDITLKRYLEEVMKPQPLGTLGNETFFWFGDNNYTEWQAMFDIYKRPPYKLPRHSGAYSFGIAGAGTGVPFHFHGPGFGEVIYGRKRWFLYPPHQQPKFHPDKTTLHWLMNDYPNLADRDRPYECTMRPGEAIYFPDHWWHGTLNIDTSVFISTFLSPF